MTSTIQILAFSCLIAFIGCTKSSEEIISDQESDQIQLDSAYAEIIDFTEGTPCTDGKDWKVKPIGAKACGGPTGFIPYAINSDTTTLFAMIDAYTQAQKEFNIKHSIVSDCAVPQPPNHIVCEEGKPKLVYE